MASTSMEPAPVAAVAQGEVIYLLAMPELASSGGMITPETQVPVLILRAVGPGSDVHVAELKSAGVDSCAAATEDKKPELIETASSTVGMKDDKCKNPRVPKILSKGENDAAGRGLKVTLSWENQLVEDNVVYVNPKQYNRILVRRVARAKLEASGRIPKNRKAYLHESRHKHTTKRKRGPGGRFLPGSTTERSTVTSIESNVADSTGTPNDSYLDTSAVNPSANCLF